MTKSQYCPSPFPLISPRPGLAFWFRQPHSSFLPSWQGHRLVHHTDMFSLLLKLPLRQWEVQNVSNLQQLISSPSTPVYTQKSVSRHTSCDGIAITPCASSSQGQRSTLGFHTARLSLQLHTKWSFSTSRSFYFKDQSRYSRQRPLLHLLTS